jgi:hypothetical protein
MIRHAHRTSGRLPSARPERHTTRELARLPKGWKHILCSRGRNVPLSPSQPHSKSFMR